MSPIDSHVFVNVRMTRRGRFLLWIARRILVPLARWCVVSAVVGARLDVPERGSDG